MILVLGAPAGALIAQSPFAEIIRNLDAGAEVNRDLVQQKITGLMPTKKDLIDSTPAIRCGTVLGSILGILPGGGAVIASFAA